MTDDLDIFDPMNDAELEIYQDSSGQLRRMGSLAPPAGFVSSFRVFEDERPIWDDADIRKAITDPDRRRGRKLFGTEWVQNQGSHGSCNGYALAGALAKARFARGIQDKLLLSGAFPYSLMNGNRDNGSMLEDGLKVVQSHGSCPESLVPWNLIYRRQQPATAVAEAAKHKGLQCYAAKTMQGFRTGVAAGYLGVVCVMAGSRFDRLDANGIAGVDSGSGNHAVHVDDLCLIKGTEVFDHMGSWSQSYGTQGRAYLHKDSFAQTFGVHTFYLIPTTDEAE